jgi:dTMP kinase
MSGKFITLEGGEGVGKSTQSKRLAEALRARGIDLVETREPGGSPGAEAIRKLLLEGADDRWTPQTEALLFAAARADHVARTIRPALQAGRWVLCDRFLDSSLAYQGGASGLGEDAVRSLHIVGCDALLPDRTLLLNLPAEIAAARETARDAEGKDRFGERDAAYREAVAEAFRMIAINEPERIHVIDASGSPEEVTARLLADLEDLL